MRRCLTTLLATLVLAACGGAGDGGRTPTIELPLQAPANTNAAIADFIEVCSATMADVDGFPGIIAGRDGWQLPKLSRSEMAIMGELGIYNAEASFTTATLRAGRIDFPHAEGAYCQLNIFGSDLPEAADLNVLNDLPGFIGQGGVRDLNQLDAFLGRWSGIGPDGHAITLEANLTPNPGFLFINMGTTRPSAPSSDDK